MKRHTHDLYIIFILVFGYQLHHINGLEEYFCSSGEVVMITNATSRITTREQGDTFYSGNLYCQWYIRAPEGKRVQVQVVSSDLQYAPTGGNCYGYDFVGVMEEMPEESYDYYPEEDPDTFQFCGTENPYTFSSKDQDLFIEFQSTVSNILDERGVVMEVHFFSDHTCPPGWVEDDTLGEDVLDHTQRCYKLRNHTESWHAAQSYCHYEHSNLVSFANDREADFVTEYVQSREEVGPRDHVWIGLNDIRQDGEYVWIDEISSTVNFRWEDSYKPNLYDNCVSFRKRSGLWQEDYCSAASIQSLQKNVFVCKANKYGGTTRYPVPADRAKKPNRGQDVPIIGITIGIIIGVGILVVVVMVIVLCVRRKQVRQRMNKSQRPEISYTDIPLQGARGGRGGGSGGRTGRGSTSSRPDIVLTPTHAHPSAASEAEVHPPSYDEALRS